MNTKKLKNQAVQMMKDLLNQKIEIHVPSQLIELAQEVIAVPEKPSGYVPFFVANPTESKRVIVLLSGGLDSTVAYLRARSNQFACEALYVDIGQPYRYKEIAAIEKMGIKCELAFADDSADIDFLHASNSLWDEKYWKHIIPGRNLIMILAAAERLGEDGGSIIFSATNGEIPAAGGDMSTRFLRLANELLTPKDITVLTPIADMTKTDLVEWAVKGGFDEKIQHTVSCFSEDSEEGHCGKCVACLRKWIAFTNNGLNFETRVPVDHGCRDHIWRYWKNMSSAMLIRDYTQYSQRRCFQTLRALKRLNTIPLVEVGRVHNALVAAFETGIVSGWHQRQIPENLLDNIHRV